MGRNLARKSEKTLPIILILPLPVTHLLSRTLSPLHKNTARLITPTCLLSHILASTIITSPHHYSLHQTATMSPDCQIFKRSLDYWIRIWPRCWRYLLHSSLISSQISTPLDWVLLKWSHIAMRPQMIINLTLAPLNDDMPVPLSHGCITMTRATRRRKRCNISWNG